IFTAHYRWAARLHTLCSWRNHLDEHLMVERADRAARRQAMIDAHALPARGPPIDQRTALRQEAILRILRIEPRFNGVAAQHQLMLIERQLFARGYVQLPSDEIKTRDPLGDCVLDLKAGIH